jgi:protein gp37
MGQPKYQNDGNPRTSGPGFGVTVHPDVLEQPLRWKQPRRIFVNSMSDLFHKDVPDEYIARVFAVMALTPHHTYQVLTKRHARMRSLLSSKDEWRELLYEAADWAVGIDLPIPAERFAEVRRWIYGTGRWPEIVPPLPNVWLGVSAEDQPWWDIRIPALLETPAAVRFVSAEPLLGEIDFRGTHRDLDWVIVGGESGPGARPMDIAWARYIAEQCADSEVPLFVKQLGSVLGRELGAGPKGGDWDAWPEDLRVREFPPAAEPRNAGRSAA